MRIHKEGKGLLFLTTSSWVIIGVVLWVWSGWPVGWLIGVTLLGVVKLVFLLQFFRNPKVSLDAVPYEVYAPASGRVVQVFETEEPECFPGGKCLQVSIFMSPFDVHVNRAPLEARVAYFCYHPGKYLVGWHPKASLLNERTTYLLYSQAGNHPLVLRQIAGLIARRICFYAKKDDQLQAGQEIGFIKFGSRMDIFLPLGTKVEVEVGTKVHAGRSLLARLDGGAEVKA